MPNNQLSNFQIAEQLEPWFPLFASVGNAVLRDVRAGVPILGLPRKTERANDFHRAWRQNFRPVCDHADPLVSMVEEPEGLGLDYLVFRLVEDAHFTMRWGRYDGTTVNRNATVRTRTVYEQGTLFGSSDEDGEDLPVVTLGFTVADDYTEIGIPQWWIGRLVLIREREDVSEFITEVHPYQKPVYTIDDLGDIPSPIVTAREEEVEEWQQMVNQILSA